MTCSYCGAADHSLNRCPWKDRTMKRTAYILVLAMSAAGVTGCATLDGKLDNRVACTVAKDKAFVVSEYGPIGITGKLHDADSAVICK